MRKYDHKKEFFSRRRLYESQDWTAVIDGEDLKTLGVYDALVGVYGDKVADLFYEWASSPEYEESEFKIWVPVGEPSSATISKDGEGLGDEATLLVNDQITFSGIGIGGLALSPRYLKSNLVKIRSDLENDDVLFHGPKRLLGHVRADSEVETFQDPEGNVDNSWLD